MSWVRLRPELVCEVTFDYLQGNRFPPRRHVQALASRQAADGCSFDQIATTPPYELRQIFA